MCRRWRTALHQEHQEESGTEFNKESPHIGRFFVGDFTIVYIRCVIFQDDDMTFFSPAVECRFRPLLVSAGHSLGLALEMGMFACVAIMIIMLFFHMLDHNYH